MKAVFSLFILFIISINHSSMAAGSHDYKAPFTEEDFAQFSQISQKQKKKGLISLSAKICNGYFFKGENYPKFFDTTVRQHLREYYGIKHAKAKQIVNFLNVNKQELMCHDVKNGVKLSYMAFAFDRGAEKSIFRKVFRSKYINEDKSARINVNVVSLSGPNGEPETVLDYMNRKLANTKNNPGLVRAIKRLKRSFIKNLKAKTFNELDKDTQLHFLRLAQQKAHNN